MGESREVASTQAERAARFHELHQGPGLLLLPNAWDGGSAAVLAAAGFPAVASTSSGVAWSLGRRDGERVARADQVAVISRIVAAAPGTPVTADVETGYGRTPADVAETVRLVLAAGAIGVNLEDAADPTSAELLSPAGHSERVAAVRAEGDRAGLRLFINARTDVYLRAVGDPAGRFDRTVERALAYIAAGADGIFVPGVGDLEILARLAAAIPAPLNVLLRPGLAAVAELEGAGVRRLSTGGRLAESMLGRLRRQAQALRETGDHQALFEDGLTFAEAQRLFPAS